VNKIVQFCLNYRCLIIYIHSIQCTKCIMCITNFLPIFIAYRIQDFRGANLVQHSVSGMLTGSEKLTLVYVRPLTSENNSGVRRLRLLV
jgi:hypothetical protein